MKRIIAVALAALLLLGLAGCAKTPAPAPTPEPTATPAPTPTPEQFRFTRENFPRLNGSTAMVPLGQAIASVMLGETREQVREDMGQLDPQIVQNAMRKLAMLHVEQGRPMS